MKTKYRVLRYSNDYQILYKYWFLLGFVIWRKEIAIEQIPSFVSISCACFGDTSGWVSRFAPFDKDGWKR